MYNIIYFCCYLWIQCTGPPRGLRLVAGGRRLNPSLGSPAGCSTWVKHCARPAMRRTHATHGASLHHRSCPTLPLSLFLSISLSLSASASIICCRITIIIYTHRDSCARTHVHRLVSHTPLPPTDRGTELSETGDPREQTLAPSRGRPRPHDQSSRAPDIILHSMLHYIIVRILSYDDDYD